MHFASDYIHPYKHAGGNPARCRVRMPTPLVWIEHWPEESTGGGEERFDLVDFSSYEVTERAPYLEETRAGIGEPTWKTLDRDTVEVLVKGKV